MNSQNSFRSWRRRSMAIDVPETKRNENRIAESSQGTPESQFDSASIRFDSPVEVRSRRLVKNHNQVRARFLDQVHSSLASDVRAGRGRTEIKES